MCTQMSFDASFDCERTSLIDLLPKLKENYFLNLCRLFQTFLSGFTNDKSGMAFFMPTGLPGEAVKSILGYAWLYKSGLAKVLLRCGIFSIVFALSDKLL